MTTRTTRRGHCSSWLFVMAFLVMALLQQTSSMTVPSGGLGMHVDNKRKPMAMPNINFRGGDVVFKSPKRMIGGAQPIKGVYTATASLLILAFPVPTFQVVRLAAAVILVSSVLQVTLHKGFL